MLTCDMPPPDELLQSWKPRRENQIMGLEIVSIALGARCRVAATGPGNCSVHATGVSSFAEELRNRDCVVWSDNSGAEHALRKGVCLLIPPLVATGVACACMKGATKAFDHNALVHTLWRKFMDLGMDVQIMRVPTNDNIADNPSRQELTMLARFMTVLCCS